MDRSLLLTIGVLAWPAQAQDLTKFLEGARRASFEVRRAQAASALSGAEARGAWGRLLPSLSAQGGWTRNQYEAVVTFPSAGGAPTEVVIVPRDQLDATLRAELPLLNVAGWIQAASAARAAGATELREEVAWRNVQKQVVNAYYAYAGARGVLDSATASLEASVAAQAEQRARRGAGLATPLELSRAAAEVERNRQVVADAEAALADAARSLETLSGVRPVDVPSLGRAALSEPPSLEDSIREVERLPAVEAAEAEAVAAAQRATAAATALVPVVTAQATQRFTNATGFQGEPALWNAGLQFSWGLDLSAVETWRGAQAQALSARIASEQERRLTEDQIHSDWHRVRAARTKVVAAQAQLKAAREAATFARERYRAGVASQLDVIQAERDVLSAEVGDIRARFDLATARGALQLDSGGSLEVTP